MHFLLNLTAINRFLTVPAIPGGPPVTPPQQGYVQNTTSALWSPVQTLADYPGIMHLVRSILSPGLLLPTGLHVPKGGMLTSVLLVRPFSPLRTLALLLSWGSHTSPGFRCGSDGSSSADTGPSSDPPSTSCLQPGFHTCSPPTCTHTDHPCEHTYEHQFLNFTSRANKGHRSRLTEERASRAFPRFLRSLRDSDSQQIETHCFKISVLQRECSTSTQVH